MIDYAALYHDLERVRQQRGKRWHAIWRTLPQNVPVNVGWLIGQGDPLPRQVLEPLAAWGGLDLANYQQKQEA